MQTSQLFIWGAHGSTESCWKTEDVRNHQSASEGVAHYSNSPPSASLRSPCPSYHRGFRCQPTRRTPEVLPAALSPSLASPLKTNKQTKKNTLSSHTHTHSTMSQFNHSTHPALDLGFPSCPEPALASLCTGRPCWSHRSQKYHLQIQTAADWWRVLLHPFITQTEAQIQL